ncbi:hypothetical protein D9758_015994 [Tetrapyrgos nigripes]|uniref:Uncharacterized protein n=1 Tax=Tetrapyrgos nigripes TaxID=182062 RepID=A0A8H5BVN3_9AGAR|nr:hypothetical protein D9758_015994 [Tetrapyrgos nigripes]
MTVLLINVAVTSLHYDTSLPDFTGALCSTTTNLVNFNQSRNTQYAPPKHHLTVNDITNAHAPSVPIRRPNNPNVAPPYRNSIAADSETTKKQHPSQRNAQETRKDVIISLSDDLTVPFALTAGLSSLGTSRLVALAV